MTLLCLGVAYTHTHIWEVGSHFRWDGLLHQMVLTTQTYPVTMFLTIALLTLRLTLRTEKQSVYLLGKQVRPNKGPVWLLTYSVTCDSHGNTLLPTLNARWFQSSKLHTWTKSISCKRSLHYDTRPPFSSPGHRE